ncbi:hypothetical protein GJV14_13635 [Enterobacteriaceae bacterium RIT697]|uniref:hypothetical protein n=1 Tax=Pantoea endophytica TaxID=92488 RepID=UPI0012ADB08F|nr:hypothetical protein [Pantoea endophytica]MRT24984.1 hypothetical protein [Enterobacteriaceae bacterium RIT697]
MTEAVPLSNLINKTSLQKKHPNLLLYIQKTKIFHIEIPIFRRKIIKQTRPELFGNDSGKEEGVTLGVP